MHPCHHAQVSPHKAAYIMASTGVAVTYGELEARANQLAHVWRSRGLGSGMTIALVLENHEWFFPIVWSAQRSGLYFVCLSHTLSPSDLAYILEDSGAELVVGSAKTEALLRAAVATGATPDLVLLDGASDEASELHSLLAVMPSHPIVDESGGTDMLYSSGTTGRPKGVKRPIYAGAPIDTPTPLMAVAKARFGMDESTIYLSPAPLYHAGPLRWAMLVHRLGGTVVVMDKFDANSALDLIERHKVTASQWVPTHFIRMLQLPEDVRRRANVSSMKAAIHAAAPCPKAVKEAMLDWWGPIVHEFYGGTENNGMTMIGPDEWLTHPGSVGRAFIGTIRICDDEGAVLPPGQEGGIYFEGGPTFEYHNDKAKTEASRNERGWTTLGDIGRLDEEGYLYLTDRKSFMIISGGVNIYPQEIENVLAVHPKVADVAVIGAPDPEMGERVIAVVQPREWSDARADLAADLQRFAREQLGGVKVPRQIDFMEELPREPTGKLFKRLLKERYWSVTGSEAS